MTVPKVRAKIDIRYYNAKKDKKASAATATFESMDLWGVRHYRRRIGMMPSRKEAVLSYRIAKTNNGSQDGEKME